LQADTYIRQARDYLQSAGRQAFTAWFNGLDDFYQQRIMADPEFARLWRAASAPAWQPDATALAAVAQRNKEVVDALKDRTSTSYSLGGVMMLIGDGHASKHAEYVSAASDHSSGRVTVRKAAFGRGVGTLTFTGVPISKQELVKSAVARFSRKDVIFA
jgi:hypothetical protein